MTTEIVRKKTKVNRRIKQWSELPARAWLEDNPEELGVPIPLEEAVGFIARMAASGK